MKKIQRSLFFITLSVMLTTAVYGQTRSVNLSEAFAAANIVENGTIETYYGTTTNIITPSTTISDPYLVSVLASNAEKWVIFVDQEPGKNWSHNCAYYYIPKSIPLSYSSVPYYCQSAQMPVSDYTLSPHSIHMNHVQHMPSIDAISLDQLNQNIITHTYAVILSGGWDISVNYARYWNDCSFIYQTLKKRYGIPQSNIRVLISDGTDSGDDMRVGYNLYVSSPLDLDGDNICDITCAATKQNLTAQLQSLADVMTSQDRLFFFVIDHGSVDQYGNAMICLWNHDTIYDYELSDLLDDFDVASMNIVMGQCYSGGFIDNLAASNRIISTACSDTEVSYATNNLVYDEFMYQWTTAINERDDYNVWIDSDTDNNGFVNMTEAFNYAYAHDVEKHNETPQFYTPSTSFANSWAFNSVAFNYELIVKDNYGDVGDEPNTTTSVGWDSPYIWMRQVNDSVEAHQNVSILDQTQQLYTYVKIVNNGEKPYYGNGRYLRLYWADASLAITRDLWLGNDGQCGGPTRESLPINKVIEPGDSVIMLVNWSVPTYILNNVNTLGVDFHICFLAAIQDTFYYNTGYLPVQTGSNVVQPLDYNYIAQKNAFFVNPEQSANPEIRLHVRNVENEDANYSIELIPAQGHETGFSNMEMNVRLSDALLETWEKGGKSAKGIVSYKSDPTKVYLKGLNSKLENIKLSSGQDETIRCSCAIIASEDISEPKVCKYDLIQRDMRSGTVVGGERIEIQVKPRKAILPIVEQKCSDDICLFTVTNVNEEAKYEWFDQDGYKVGEGEEFSVVSVPNMQYQLKVTAESDGAINYATVVVGERMSIQDISPIPFTNQLCVKLATPADHRTYIRLTPVSSVGVSKDYQVKEGDSALTIYMNDSSKGTYLVSLLHDGKVVSSRQITRK